MPTGGTEWRDPGPGRGGGSQKGKSGMYTVISLSDSDRVTAKVDASGLVMRIGELFGTNDGFRHEMVLPLTDELKAALRTIVAGFPVEVDTTADDATEHNDKQAAQMAKGL